MRRKVFRTGNSLVVSLSREVLEYLGIQEGAVIEVNIDRENHQVVINPVEGSFAIAGVDKEFSLLVFEFIT